MFRKFSLLFFSILFCQLFISQQVVKGKVVDLESQFPMPGVNVQIIDGDFSSGVATSSDGKFKISDVPLGRHQIRFTFIGYKPLVQTIVVNSGREVILNISIEESTEMLEEFEISANENREVNNEMAIISAQQFSVEETERYAGSRGDPARMASNLAGVQGADDSRNDIVVRGNSPLGVIYRVEGITIPNPNHFAISGSSGGPLSILNNKFLGNSDFFSGAFPAEYGNSTAGVFDLKIRNGNSEKTEFTGQVGLFGAEFLMEGPLSKNSSASYLFMYRKATLKAFDVLGLDLGTSAIPNYQDFAAKINLPLNKGGNLALWAMGGNSNINIMVSEQDSTDTELYGENTKDQKFRTSMMVGGVTYTKPLNEKSFIKSTTCINLEQQKSNHDTVSRGATWSDVTTNPYMAYNFNTTRYSNASSYNKKLNKKNTLKIGWVADFSFFNFIDSVTTNSSLQTYRDRFNTQGSSFMAQPYISWKHKFSDDFIMTAGLTSLYLAIFDADNTKDPVINFSPIEPRFGMRWNINDKSALSFGLGYHSQTQPLYTRYYLMEGNNTPHNKELGLSYSKHIVLGYSHQINKNFGIKTEAYYQDLTGIPIEVGNLSAFSLINAGSGFARVFPNALENDGTGYNYGLELTIQRYFNKNWHALFTGCLYNSKYTPRDGVERNTSFNGLYAANFLAGKEFEVGKNKVLGLGLKVTGAGGKRKGVLDPIASAEQGEVIFKDEGFNEGKFKDYFRFDIKTTYKINKEKITHEIGLDLVNLTGAENILNYSYAPNNDGVANEEDIVLNYQLGFLPIFYYRIDF